MIGRDGARGRIYYITKTVLMYEKNMFGNFYRSTMRKASWWLKVCEVYVISSIVDEGALVKSTLNNDIQCHMVFYDPKPRACDRFIICNRKVTISNVFERLWKSFFVFALKCNHRHRVTWYCVSTSFTVLCTSNSYKVLVLKLQPHLHVLLGDLDHRELSQS